MSPVFKSDMAADMQIERMLGDQLRATTLVDPIEALPPEWLEMIARTGIGAKGDPAIDGKAT